MNNRQSNRRRGRGNPRPQNNNRGGGFDHQNTIDNRSRGNANQMLEKFKKQANDAQLNDDRVNAEHYLQVADHYFRVLADYRGRQEAKQERQEQRNDDNQTNKQNNDGDNQSNNSNNHNNQSGHKNSGENAASNNSKNENADNRDQPNSNNDKPAPRTRRVSKAADTVKGDSIKKPRTPRKKPENRNTSQNTSTDDGSIDIAVLPPSLAIDEPAAEEKPKKRAPRKKIVKKTEDNSQTATAEE